MLWVIAAGYQLEYNDRAGGVGVYVNKSSRNKNAGTETVTHQSPSQITESWKAYCLDKNLHTSQKRSYTQIRNNAQKMMRHPHLREPLNHQRKAACYPLSQYIFPLPPSRKSRT